MPSYEGLTAPRCPGTDPILPRGGCPSPSVRGWRGPLGYQKLAVCACIPLPSNTEGNVCVCAYAGQEAPWQRRASPRAPALPLPEPTCAAGPLPPLQPLQPRAGRTCSGSGVGSGAGSGAGVPRGAEGSGGAGRPHRVRSGWRRRCRSESVLAAAAGHRGLRAKQRQALTDLCRPPAARLARNAPRHPPAPRRHGAALWPAPCSPVAAGPPSGPAGGSLPAPPGVPRVTARSILPPRCQFSVWTSHTHTPFVILVFSFNM